MNPLEEALYLPLTICKLPFLSLLQLTWKGIQGHSKHNF